MGGKDLDLEAAFLHQLVHQGRQDVLFFELVSRGVFQEIGQLCPGGFKIPGSKAEEVHGNQGVVRQGDPGGIAGEILDDAVRVPLDLVGLDHLGQEAFAVPPADAAGHRPVFGDGVFQVIGHHRSGGLLPGHPVQAVCHSNEGVLAVIIVRVDDGKGLVDDVLGAVDGVDGAVGLRPVFGGDKAVRQAVVFLVGVVGFYLLGDLVADHLPEHLVHAPADHEHHLVKAGADGVMDGILHQNFPARADVVDLLVAPVAGAQTGGHDQQCRFHYNAPLYFHQRPIRQAF